MLEGTSMYHYTYAITYTTGKYYLGVRSCKCLPEEDTKYVGSSKYTPNDKIFAKEILGTFSTREEAIAHEIVLHEEWDVGNNDLFYNRSKQTSRSFDTTGVKITHTKEHRDKIKKALTGRIRSPEECLNISKGKKGKSHKPHSAEAREKMSKAAKGRDGYMKGQTYSPDDQISKYSSRTKYSEKYFWKNILTDQTENMTCMEMGIKYGRGIKPTRIFRDIVKGSRKQFDGWILDNDPELTTQDEQ